ncbi:MAG: hypothetical protein AAF943_14975 [Pseudomonadota bacterium]
MKTTVLFSLVILGLSGCALVEDVSSRLQPAPDDAAAAGEAPADPFVQDAPSVEVQPLSIETAAPPPPPNAQTAEALDTTTPEQRTLASQPVTGPTQSLGTTVVSLGSPTEPGLWLKTPLVTEAAQGRVTNPATGQSSLVSLIPLEGEETAGSRMSIGALRLIGASLTALTEVEVALDG